MIDNDNDALSLPLWAGIFASKMPYTVPSDQPREYEVSYIIKDGDLCRDLNSLVERYLIAAVTDLSEQMLQPYQEPEITKQQECYRQAVLLCGNVTYTVIMQYEPLSAGTQVIFNVFT